MPSVGRITLISGIPGAGRTTVARLLASRCKRGVHVEGDILQRMIASGSEWPRAKISPEPKASSICACVTPACSQGPSQTPALTS